MPKCNDCENDDIFVIPSLSWDKVYHDENGISIDSKNVSTEDVDWAVYQPFCYSCDSEDIDWDYPYDNEGLNRA